MHIAQCTCISVTTSTHPHGFSFHHYHFNGNPSNWRTSHTKTHPQTLSTRSPRHDRHTICRHAPPPLSAPPPPPRPPAEAYRQRMARDAGVSFVSGRFPSVHRSPDRQGCQMSGPIQWPDHVINRTESRVICRHSGRVTWDGPSAGQ